MYECVFWRQMILCRNISLFGRETIVKTLFDNHLDQLASSVFNGYMLIDDDSPSG